MKEEEKLGHLLGLAHQRFEAEKQALVAESGVTRSQLDVLNFLAGRGGKATQSEIGMFFRTSRATVSGLVTRLERRGLVTRDSSVYDGRVVLVRLTDKAWPVVRACQKRLEGLDERLTDGFTDEERETLIRLLRSVAGIDEA